MNDGFFRSRQRFEGALDQVLARLHEHLEPHVVGRAVLFDEPAVEGKLGVGSGGESDLDLFEAAFNQRLKELELLADVHRHREGLVAIAKVHTAPEGRAREDAIGPLPVRQMDRCERTILLRRVLQHRLNKFAN